MSKRTIIAIVGPSGSGKTTLSLTMYGKYSIPYIASYTTRPMREGETDGVEHTFVSESKMPDRSEMIAYTYFGGYHYWATKSQVKYKPTTYVIDEKGLLELKERFSDEFNIISVYVMRENNDVDQERIDRDADRVILDESEYDIVISNHYDNVDDFIKFAPKDLYHRLLYKLGTYADNE
jgi:guanylate kinase